MCFSSHQLYSKGQERREDLNFLRGSWEENKNSVPKRLVSRKCQSITCNSDVKLKAAKPDGSCWTFTVCVSNRLQNFALLNYTVTKWHSLVTGFVLFSCCSADLGWMNGGAVCEVICDKMRHMLSHFYKPAAAQLFLFEYFTFMWEELGCTASHHEIWIQTARKWAPAWNRGCLGHEQPYQAELLCLPSVWFALSSQSHHLGAAVGVPLTEHLQQQQGPRSSCWGCPFYHSSHLICWGEHQLKGLWSRPLTSDSTATCIGVIAATVFIHAAILAHKHNNNKKKTCDSNLKLYIS